MEKEAENNLQLASQNETEKSETDKKYNFYRKPSIKKKAPEVKQTLTSYKRMLKANPLLKLELEGKDMSHISKQFKTSFQNDKFSNGLKKLPGEKQSLQPNSDKLPVSNLQRSNSSKNPPKPLSRPMTKTTSIISGNKPKTSTNIQTVNLSRQSQVDFNPSTSRFMCSTKLEPSSNAQKKSMRPTTNVTAKVTAKRSSKTGSSTQDNCVSSSAKPLPVKEKKRKPIRRSLSAQHFDRKKGVTTVDPGKCFNHVNLTQSLNDVTSHRPAEALISIHDISAIAEGSQESSIIFKTPSAYERRSVARFTPMSAMSSRRSLYHPTTPLPSLNDLQERLNQWLTKRGKSLSSFHHLKCFGIPTEQNNMTIVDEENKENIEVDQDLDKGSYEDLKIPVAESNGYGPGCEHEKHVVNDVNAEHVARIALEDLLKLIQEGYPRPQCEGWLELIRQKYRGLEEEPQYWECRAAIEQSRGNISSAVECYRTAIVQGAEIQAVDESLDVLLQKFSLLNISANKAENERLTRERARILRDARNVFKSSIIQFAVQERKLRKDKQEEQRKLIATPVRRSTRLSRTAYTSTPGVKICSSLRELNCSDVDFQKNKALF